LSLYKQKTGQGEAARAWGNSARERENSYPEFRGSVRRISRASGNLNDGGQDRILPAPGKDTQKEIADEVGLTQQAIDLVLQEMAKLPKLVKAEQAAANHATDFDLWLSCHTQKEIAELVGCPRTTVEEVLTKAAELPESSKAAANHATDFDLWLSCHTQKEIAELVGCPRETVRDECNKFGDIGNIAESAKAAANHATDFDPPLYNVWKYREKTG